MSPNPRVDNAHSQTDAKAADIAMIEQAASPRWPVALISGVILTFFLGMGWFLAGATKAKPEMAVVFQGRSFDRAGRRSAMQHLIREGVAAVEGARGELLVPPGRLVEAQTSLEKAGLKPETLEEARSAAGGSLAILESPDQRDQRRRQAKEKELAWLIRRMDEIGDAHVSLEEQASISRWIGRRDAVRHRVRVFVEPERIEQGLTEGTVDRIERLILASLPNASAGQVTIHDDRRIYRMADAGRSGKSSDVRSSESEEERGLAAKIHDATPELSGFSILVSLKQVEEGPPAQAAAAGAVPASSTRLFFNKPVLIEDEPATQPATAVRTRRARVRIAAPPGRSSEVAAAEKRLEIRKRISSAIAPVLVEQVEWQSMPVLASQEKALIDTDKGRIAESPAVGVSDQPMKSIDEGQPGETLPWILGGVGLAVVIGGVFIGRMLRYGQDDQAVSSGTLEGAAPWAIDLGDAVSERPVRQGPHEIPTDKAAQVLSSWLGSVESGEDAA